MAHTRESRAHVYMYLHHLREYTLSPSSIGDLKQDISKNMHDSIFGLQNSNIWNC